MNTITYSLPSSVSSIVFACIATTLLLAFLIWRSVRLCAICCKCGAGCMPDPNGLERKDKYLKGNGIAGVKVLGGILSLCLIAASLYGIITTAVAGRYSNTNLVQQGWAVIDSLIGYVAKTVVTVRALMYNLNSAGITMAQILNLTNTSTCKYGPPLSPQFAQDAWEVTYQAYNVTYQAGMTANSIYQSLVQTYINTHNTWEETTLKVWNYVLTGYLVILALVLLITLLYIASMIFNHRTGLFWTTTLNLFLSLLFFILCIAFTIGLASLKESCYSVEGFITASNTFPPAQALLKYYLNSNSNPSDDFNVLEAAAINITAVQQILDDPIMSPTNPIYPRFLNNTNIISGCIIRHNKLFVVLHLSGCRTGSLWLNKVLSLLRCAWTDA